MPPELSLAITPMSCQDKYFLSLGYKQCFYSLRQLIFDKIWINTTPVFEG